jgi:Tfp pilus tip-associated adhesin PilY1
MNVNLPLISLARIIGGAVLSCSFVLSAYAAQTALSNEPFSSSSAVTAKPNIMFVLDDSGSMKEDYLPDWAGPYQQLVSSVLTVITPAYRFFNNSFNGVAYNPGTRYRPPVMYTSTGALDTTTYPSMTGVSTASGGDGSATLALPNWRAVKVDGYGIQSTAIISLEGQAFSYTTVPGEYCDSKQLRTCTASASATGSYTQAAALRWCTTDANANAAAPATGTCQASNIANTAANIAAGVTPYIYPRMPRPRTSTITVNAAGTVTGITVDTQQILHASATGGGSVDLATDIALKINACTYAIPASSGCTVVGFSAVTSSNVVLVTAPTITSSSPVVSGGATSVVAFSGGYVPGGSLFTVITPSVNSYPFPGTATKSVNRTDCAGTTCTYAEEMTNYANWYAYYRTRMQMMKTASSLAFANVDDNFRVGYFTINNGSGSDFINLSAFDGVQKYQWYNRFFRARPLGATPLRTGLANAGKIYAGKIGALNTVSVTDPMQYSCQQNYTILSTDGYWNDAVNPTRLDGTEIGEQDANDPRPYYDGATQTRLSTYTSQSFQQLGIGTRLIEKLTSQLKTNTSQLTKVVTTTTQQPWEIQTSHLQTRTKPLKKSTYKLESRTYPLIATTSQLRENTFNPESSTRPLERYTYRLTETTIPLQTILTNITVKTYPLQVGTETVKSTTAPLQVGTETVKSVTAPLQVGTETVKSISAPLQVGTETVNSTTSPLQSSTYKLRSTNFQLQKRSDVSVDGGDNYTNTGWVDVTSGTCATFTGTRHIDLEINVQCQYVVTGTSSGLSACTTHTQSASSPYSALTANTCSYETVPIVAATSTCNVVAVSGSSPYAPYVTCGYGTAGATQTVSSCSAKDQTGASSMSGDKVVCAYNAISWADATGSPVACTPAAPASYGGSRITCRYGADGTAQTVSSCTGNNQSLTAPMTGNRVVCSYNTISWADATGSPVTCTPAAPASYGGSRITCRYGSDGTAQTVSSCTGNNQSLTAPMSGNRVVCGYNTVSWADATGSPVTCTPAAPASYGGSRITCRYGSDGTAQTVSSCTGNNQSLTAPMSGNRVVCGYNTISWADATGSPVTCTPAAPASYGGSRITCRYSSSASNTSPGQTTCAPNDQVLTAAMTGNKVTCAYDASPTSTTTTTSCQWSTSATAVTQQTTCAYNAGAATTATVDPCSPVAQSTGTSNGTTWNGPAKTCAYQTATVDTNLTACSPTSSSAGPPYHAYTTCGYGTAVVTSGTSCTQDLPESGPSYTLGKTVACAYPGTPTSTSSPKSTCTWIAPSATWAAPVVTCTYDADVLTSVTTCTDQAKSTGGSGTYAGPATSCGYQAAVGSQDLNASSCTPYRQSSGPYTGGAAIDCTYNATATVTDVTTCTDHVDTGPYTGAKIACSDAGAFSAWANVSSGSCVVAGQSGPPSYVQWRECQYTDPTAEKTYGNTCTEISPSAGPTTYSVLTPKHCVAGSYVTSTTANTTTVNSCATDPTQTGDTSLGTTQVNTTTTCTYAASPTVASAISCNAHPRDASSPYATEVLCSSTAGSWTPVGNADCTSVIVGTQPLNTVTTTPSEFVGGINVACRSTEGSAVVAGTGTVAAPAKTASCTAGTNPTTQVQTFCSYLINSTPTRVNASSCTPTVGLPTEPDFIKEICTPTIDSSQVMGCTEQVSSAPLYETVTCSYNNDGSSNTLADVAAYYYKTDLRTPALNNCTGAVVPPATTGNVLCSTTDPMNNVRSSATDPNAAQHMTTFTLGLGASGYMKYSDTYTTDAAGDFPTVKGVSPYAAINGITANPSTGVCSWQPNGLCNWPFPPVTGDEQTTIDDLWHAGINGHGAYYSARDPASLSAGISAALNGVAAAGGYAAAPSISTPNLVLNDNYLFTSSYVSLDWTGELLRWRVDPYTGTVAGVSDWSAQAKLDVKAYTSRAIYTFDASVATTKLKAFTSANFGTNSYFNTPYISATSTGLSQYLCTSPDICLTATDQDNSHASGNNLVNYLRGDRANEGTETDNTKYYRQRQHVLGDIVNAQSLYVFKPTREYSDPGYAAFKTAQATRQAVVYAAANDGMLHAFAAKGNATTEALVDIAASAYAASQANPSNATLLSTANATAAAASEAIASDPVAGQELWAYIPTMVLPKLYKLADKKYRNMHRYLVDATPTFGDVCVSNCGDAATAVWKTILIAGLGHGGRGFYALDITDPANPKALWEFTNANLGYSYGNVQITKLSNGTWVVLLSSGYNNIPNDDGSGGDGVGRLFVLNAGSGAQITGVSPISTGFGDVTTPSGLASISSIVLNPQTDNTVVAAYGGDLYGNLWRFDINDSVGPTGTEAQLLAVLKDATGNRQPITTKPILTEVRGQKVVYVGTGRFLDSIDIADTSQQSLYAIKDPWVTGGTAATAIYDNPGDDRTATARNTKGFVRQTYSWISCPATTLTSICLTGDQVMTSTNNAVDFTADSGWFVDLINPSEKANTNPALGLGMLVFTTNAPSLLACDIGGKSYVYFLNYLTGGPIYSPGNPGGVVGYLLANSFASAPTIVVRATPTGGVTTPVILVSVAAASTSGTTGGTSGSGSTTTTTTPSGVRTVGGVVPPDATRTRRTSWRELITE